MRDSYKFCPWCKAELKQKPDHKVCPSCDRQYYFNPKPTVSIVLINNQDQLLLTKRLREPFKDWWDLPGGFVEQGETFEEAAKRELKEEVNANPQDLKYIGSFSDDYRYRGTIIPVVAAVFTAEISDNTTIVVADDVSDYKFMKISEIEIDKIAFASQRLFIQKYFKK